MKGIRINKYILGFNISVDKIEAMHIGESLTYLIEYVCDLIFT